MKIRKFNESEDVNISNDRVNEIIDDLKDTLSLLEDKNNTVSLYLNELDNHKSKSIKSNNQIDDSISALQIVKKCLDDSVDKIDTVISNLDDYNINGSDVLYSEDF